MQTASMQKNKSLVGTAALLIPASVLAGMAYSFEQELVSLMVGLALLFAIPIGVAAITIIYIKLKVD